MKSFLKVETLCIDSNGNPLVLTKKFWRRNGPPDNWPPEDEQYLMLGYEEDGVHRPIWNDNDYDNHYDNHYDMKDNEMSIVCEKGILSS